MQFMRIHYNHISLQQYKMTLITEKDNEPDEAAEPAEARFEGPAPGTIEFA
ncbi:hypothetical protein M885DRAFT_569560 [Pelagophyceae sp. CCMP2097]|nr:hypothetical protein M885DRAFT_569560 [Pelagophyceae sp. CCMP2097]